MPKRSDIHSILIIGSGPIVIGQACEFDYSGAQACKSLREEGYRVVLVNSNPATIMTDPEMADGTYIEPLTVEAVERIIEKERPDALLPTLGGQTGLNLAIDLAEAGVLEKYGVEMIGATFEAIQKAEDRDLFKKTMQECGLSVPISGIARNLEEGMEIVKETGYPAILRPAFTLGGAGGGVAENEVEYKEKLQYALDISPINEVLVEQSIIGWKEFEMEVMRDTKDNCVIICSIENFDAMGVHTGDSITVAPAQTLTDQEYQVMRDASFTIMRAIGVETGGSNVQFAVNPENGDLIVIEMNPRVSRSSALASKATGFPIAKMAAKLAVGMTLDEIPNDITKKTPACFEPTIDYVVTKVPRFTFEKFQKADTTLNTTMKSVGETMAIARTFIESLQKACRSLEVKRFGLGADGKGRDKEYEQIRSLAGDAAERKAFLDETKEKLRVPNSERLYYVKYALGLGMSIDEVYAISKIDPWFVAQVARLVEFEERFLASDEKCSLLPEAKRLGYSDFQLGYLLGKTEEEVRACRKEKGVLPVFKLVDTCAAEFEAETPYYYSTYDEEDEVEESETPKAMILGGGPNRIGQGIEFDYCCCHAAFALKELGYETIMVNSNPETVSTDYDTSDRLYFEPLTHEDVMNIVEKEKPKGIIVQFGGQTPLNLALGLKKSGAPIFGTTPERIDLAEDREKFEEILNELELHRPPNGMARSPKEAREAAKQCGYPVLVRPSYVLGGRAMEIVYSEEELNRYMREAIEASPEHPVLIDKFLADAIEVDVDALCDGDVCFIGGIMEHVERAGIHSGDSACVIPPQNLSKKVLDDIREATVKLALRIGVVGLMNVQYAVRDETVYILEVNPRASRTVPFVAKATGVPLAKIAAKVMAGKKLKDLGITDHIKLEGRVAVKEAVLPFHRFTDTDILLGPEMRSTGEVMGLDENFGMAYGKAQLGAYQNLPREGSILITVKDEDKEAIAEVAARLIKVGLSILATKGTADFLAESGIPVQSVQRIFEGSSEILDLIESGGINMVINTPKQTVRTQEDAYRIRRNALLRGIPVVTTVAGACAAAEAIEFLAKDPLNVKSLQDHYAHQAR